MEALDARQLRRNQGGAERGGKMENGGGTHYSHPATLTVEVSAVQQESPTGESDRRSPQPGESGIIQGYK